MKLQDWPLYLQKMTSPAIGEIVTHTPIAILPVGSIEQHGSHLPIDTDLTTIEYLAKSGLEAARLKSDEPIGVIAPSLPYGGAGIGMDGWPGTIMFKPSTLIDAVFDIGQGLIAAGFRYVVVMNGCYGNIPTLMLAVQKLKREIPDGEFILVGGTWEIPEVISQVRSSRPGGMGHACELETSTSLVIDPEHVILENAVPGILYHPSERVSFDFAGGNPFYWPYPFKELTPNGIIGDPTKGNVEEGRIILEANIGRIAEILNHIFEISKKSLVR